MNRKWKEWKKKKKQGVEGERMGRREGGKREGAPCHPVSALVGGRIAPSHTRVWSRCVRSHPFALVWITAYIVVCAYNFMPENVLPLKLYCYNQHMAYCLDIISKFLECSILSRCNSRLFSRTVSDGCALISKLLGYYYILASAAPYKIILWQ